MENNDLEGKEKVESSSSGQLESSVSEPLSISTITSESTSLQVPLPNLSSSGLLDGVSPEILSLMQPDLVDEALNNNTTGNLSTTNSTRAIDSTPKPPPSTPIPNQAPQFVQPRPLVPQPQTSINPSIYHTTSQLNNPNLNAYLQANPSLLNNPNYNLNGLAALASQNSMVNQRLNQFNPAIRPALSMSGFGSHYQNGKNQQTLFRPQNIVPSPLGLGALGQQQQQQQQQQQLVGSGRGSRPRPKTRENSSIRPSTPLAPDSSGSTNPPKSMLTTFLEELSPERANGLKDLIMQLAQKQIDSNTFSAQAESLLGEAYTRLTYIMRNPMATVPLNNPTANQSIRTGPGRGSGRGSGLSDQNVRSRGQFNGGVALNNFRIETSNTSSPKNQTPPAGRGKNKGLNRQSSLKASASNRNSPAVQSPIIAPLPVLPTPPPPQPAVTPKSTPAPTAQEENRMDYDSLTDVMGSVGVDLREESENILRNTSQSNQFGMSNHNRSYNLPPPQPPFVDTSILKTKLLNIAKQYGVKEIDQELFKYLSLAVEERTRGLIEQMIQLSKHRTHSQLPYPTPSFNDSLKPPYKIGIVQDPKKHLVAIERMDRESQRQYQQQLEEGSNLDDDDQGRAKKLKSRKDISARGQAINMSEDARKQNANMTTHLFAGGVRKAWMMSSSSVTSSSPRISSPLINTPPVKPAIPNKTNLPQVSSNLASKSLNDLKDTPSNSAVPTTPNPRYPTLRQPLSRTVSLQDAIQTIQNDSQGRPSIGLKRIIVKGLSKQL